jgi:hypothetical protein
LNGAPVLTPLSDESLGGPGQFLQTTSTDATASSTEPATGASSTSPTT